MKKYDNSFTLYTLKLNINQNDEEDTKMSATAKPPNPCIESPVNSKMLIDIHILQVPGRYDNLNKGGESISVEAFHL